jgi:serine/threonine-protein kinase RsbW
VVTVSTQASVHKFLTNVGNDLVTKESKSTHNATMAHSCESGDEKLQAGARTSVPESAIDYLDSDAAGSEVPESKFPQLESRKEFEFAGVLADVPENRERVMEFVAQYCSNEDDRIDLLVAVQEALANAALHGCLDDPETTIRCVVTARPEEITISVRDPGPGFDLEKADPEKYQVTKLTHGRGIVLMRSMVTEVSFAHHGAEVILRKRLNQADDDSE